MESTHPATAQSVQVRATDTAVRDLDIDIRLLPLFGLKLLPHHVALTRTGIEAHPALELVVGLRHDFLGVFCIWPV